MKTKVIHAGVLAGVFILAILVFSYITNKDNEDLTSDIGSATLPRVSFVYGDYEINGQNGYVSDMDLATMRGAVTPVENGTVKMRIQDTDKKPQSAEYEIFSIDGRKNLYSGKIKSLEDTVEITVPQKVLADGERFLRVTLHFEGEERAYYYTRIDDSSDWNMDKCMSYVKNFHEKEMDAEAAQELKADLEPSSEGDNSTFQTVNIHSDFDHITWSGLSPEIVGDVQWEVMEANSQYMSILLSYQVNCKGEINETDRYNVKEFFRVRYSENRQMYLLDYERTMNQLFDGNKQSLTEDGILLGVTDPDVDYLVNKEGTVVSFVQERELWNYNKEEDHLSCVFSYANAENQDVRNSLDHHSIQLVSMDQDGSTTFTVTGYVNRGPQEGKVGVAVYYYDINKNSVEEIVFIPSTKSDEVLESDPGKLVYYSNTSGKLYVMQDGTLYELDLIHDTRKTLVKSLDQGQYVSSQDGHLLAYQKKGEINSATEIEVLNLATGKGYKVTAGENESIRPLGFIRNDFVYGTAKQGDLGVTASGETVVPMYKLEIRNQRNETVKTYQENNVFVLEVVFEDDMATLKRAVKSGNTYNYVAADYITNNEEREESNIYLDSYTSETRGTQIRLAYEDGIEDTSPKILQPKFSMTEGQMTLSFDSAEKKGTYYVYAFGKLQGIYQNAGYAVKKADDMDGVAVTSRLAYVYERGNKPVSYQISELGDTAVKEGENALETCMRIIMQLQKLNVEFQDIKDGESVIDHINSTVAGEALELSDCTAEQITYLVGQGIPVAALTGNGNAVLLTGYDKTTVTYFDVASQSEKTVTLERMDEMTKPAGNTYIGYTK